MSIAAAICREPFTPFGEVEGQAAGMKMTITPHNLGRLAAEATMVPPRRIPVSRPKNVDLIVVASHLLRSPPAAQDAQPLIRDSCLGRDCVVRNGTQAFIVADEHKARLIEIAAGRRNALETINEGLNEGNSPRRGVHRGGLQVGGLRQPRRTDR